MLLLPDCFTSDDAEDDEDDSIFSPIDGEVSITKTTCMMAKYQGRRILVHTGTAVTQYHTGRFGLKRQFCAGDDRYSLYSFAD